MSPALASVLDTLRSKGEVSKRGADWVAHCPCHEDNTPSLVVGDHGGKVTVQCMAGCDWRSVKDALGINSWDGQPQMQKGGREIEKRYEYTDAAGTLLYEVLRLVGKQFRQRKPDGYGGWVWSLKGVQRVLYGLPRLEQAKRDAVTVYVVEGEKDADRLNAAGLVATTAPGGANKWARSYSESLRGVEVCVIGDNDAAGHKHALNVMADLLCIGVRAIDLTSAFAWLPSKGDVSDWLDAGNSVDDLEVMAHDALSALSAITLRGKAEDDLPAPEEEHEETPPAPLALPGYPLEAWPEPVADLLRRAAEVACVDASLPASALMAALGAALGPQWELPIGGGARPLMWCAVVAPSAIGHKTIGTMAVTRAAGRIEGTEHEAYEYKHEQWKRLSRKEKDATDPPGYAGFLVGDTTLEALTRRLSAAEGESGLLLHSDELLGWLGSMDAYRPGKGKGPGKDRAAWLELRGGGHLSRDRVGTGRIYVKRTHCCLVGTIQPSKLWGAGLEDGDGLFGRLLWCSPPIPRPEDIPAGPSDALVRDIEVLLRTARRMTRPVVHVEDGAEAAIREVILEWRHAAHADHNSGQGLRATVHARAQQHLYGLIALLAGAEVAMHEGPQQRTVKVSVALVEAASALSRYHLEHALGAVIPHVLVASSDNEAQVSDQSTALSTALRNAVAAGPVEASTSEWSKRIGFAGTAAVLGKRLKALAGSTGGSGLALSKVRRSQRGRLWRVELAGK